MYIKVSILIFLFVLISGFSIAQNVDVETLLELQEHRNPIEQKGLTFITNTAGPICIALPAGLFISGVISKDNSQKQAALKMGVSLAVSEGITYSLKSIVHRNRPYESYPFITPASVQGNYSFPSGHTSAAFATATSLSLSYPKWQVIVPVYTWATLVGYSRCYLGVHYPSDVLAGALVGASSAYLSHVGQKILSKNHNHRHVDPEPYLIDN
ncbi:phosphatase PAP2 family protein [Solitalea lacus]|uniref:phosphatase PAP2 family protein n=1 Tax=Solitalea lacus TaxID=2911172 RepID=UPI001EDC6FEA|nr:phosphatase PAP2 family protein [Solitalea lacus]UKJ05841.1 phosphatase PAP2 family protein [Solitalea lacus]